MLCSTRGGGATQQIRRAVGSPFYCRCGAGDGVFFYCYYYQKNCNYAKKLMCPETRNESAIIENARAPKKKLRNERPLQMFFPRFRAAKQFPTLKRKPNLAKFFASNAKVFFFFGSLLLMEMIC